MERVCSMLSGGRIIRLLIVVLACIAVWKVWDYIGWGKAKDFDHVPHMHPEPVLDSNAKNILKFKNENSLNAKLNELEVGVKSRVSVQVFYEPLCPDSKNFVRSQLAPTMEKIGENIELSLVPYGKAKTIESGGSLSFHCQHGPTECLGNKVHACVVKHVSDTSLQTKIVSCMIADNYKPKRIVRKCVAKYLGSNMLGPIHHCYTTVEGDKLLKHMGILTDSLNPTVSFVPTVTIDGSQDNLFSVLGNFLSSVCKKIKGTLPAACM